jgi:hypothetical protein
MGRALVIIASDADRSKLHAWIAKAPWNTRVTFQGPKRSVPQNSLMWSRLTEVAEQLQWHGLKLNAEDWKLIFLDALKREVRMVPNLDGNGMVSLGRSSSDLSKEEMGDLLTLIEAFGTQNGVVFQELHEAAA